MSEHKYGASNWNAISRDPPTFESILAMARKLNPPERKVYVFSGTMEQLKAKMEKNGIQQMRADNGSWLNLACLEIVEFDGTCVIGTPRNVRDYIRQKQGIWFGPSIADWV